MCKATHTLLVRSIALSRISAYFFLSGNSTVSQQRTCRSFKLGALKRSDALSILHSDSPSAAFRRQREARGQSLVYGHDILIWKTVPLMCFVSYI